MDYVKNNRVFSLLGQRGTFGMVLKELAAENERITALSADLTRASGLEQFAAAYPDRFYNVGIAEENAVGMAAGMADQGMIPFVATFANFATLRANEFVRHFMAYMRCNVKLVGLECEFGHLHASVFSDVIVRRALDFSECGVGEPGIIQVVSTIPESYPGVLSRPQPADGG